VGVAFFFWMFNFSTLPLSAPALKTLSHGEDLLDVRLYYSAEDAFRAMDRYGADGRALYLRFLAVDFVFLVTYGFAFALLFSRIAVTLFGPSSLWIKVNLLPLGIALADCAENLFILLLLILYPDQYLLVGTMAGIATLMKWALTGFSIACLVVANLLLLARRLGFTQRQGKTIT
jgi:hypothetical protein